MVTIFTVLHILIVTIIFNYSNLVFCISICNDPRSHGHTEPEGDIYILYGDPLNITCILNDSQNYSSKDLIFLRNGTEVSKKLITILDDKRIQLYEMKPQKAECITYACVIATNNTGVCSNTVAVGVPPQNITNFMCKAFDYETLNCTFTAPNNYVKTDYNLTYHFNDKAENTGADICNLTSYTNNKETIKTCYIRKNVYRPAQRIYIFQLYAGNKFNTTFQKFVIDVHRYMIPSAPKDLIVCNATAHSFFLNWTISINMFSSPYAIEHKILYKLENDRNDWKEAVKFTTKYRGPYVSYNLTGLKYAHKYYDVRVKIRSTVTDENFWSDHANITNLTASKIPDYPPFVTFGNFERIDKDTVFLYWKEIPEYSQNGEGFDYDIVCNNTLQLEFTKSFYAKFTRYQKYLNYTCIIWSYNKVGKSENYTVVYIPPGEIPPPESVTKMLHKDKKTFQVSWKQPDISRYVHNYTVFWCYRKDSEIEKCSDALNWTIVSSHSNSINISVPKNQNLANNYQFAVAANSYTESSGMVWAVCTIDPNQEIFKIKDKELDVETTSTEMVIQWKLEDCTFVENIKHFIIYYCRPIHLETRECKEGTKKRIIAPSNVTSYKISGLQPYVTYSYSVSILSVKNKESFNVRGKPVVTKDGVPELPRNISFSEVTNSSVLLSWKKPVAINSGTWYYKILYNDNSFTIKNTNDSVKHNLTNLVSAMQYNITVVACTGMHVCPKNTPLPLLVTTKIGYPSKVRLNPVKIVDNKPYSVEWKEPDHKRGKINYYEIQIRRQSDSVNDEYPRPVVVNGATEYKINDCKDDETRVVRVRAVNIDEGKKYEGDWSNDARFSCNTERSNLLAYVLPPIIIIILLFGIYLSKKFYHGCIPMTKEDIIIPDGLGTNLDFDWMPKKPQQKETVSASPPPPDEQYLLHKLPTRNSLGDSSGCSSGQESVNSEDVPSAPSPTDSGTEHPNSSSTEEIIGNNGTIRRRYPDASEKTNNSPSNGYCKFGVNPAETSPYIPVAVTTAEMKMNAPSVNVPTPYVMTGDVSKPTSHGYITLSEVNPSQNNMMVGSKLIAIPELIRLNSVSSDDKLMYIQVSDCPKAVPQTLTELKICPESAKNNLGYVSVADISTAGSTKATFYSQKED